VSPSGVDLGKEGADMSVFMLIRDGRVVGEIPPERVTIEVTEDGPVYIVSDCLTAHDPFTVCLLCDDGSSKDLQVTTKPWQSEGSE
jgi:hypothetical protein